MMARRFTAGHCANAPIPALGLNASTPATPLNVASSMPSALHSLPPVLLPPQTPSPSHGSFCFLRHRQICKIGGKVPRAPPGQQEQTEGSSPMDAWSQRPPTHWGADAGRGEPRRPGDLHGLDPSGPCTMSIDRVLQEVEAALGPLPLVADASGPQEVAPPTTRVVATPRHLAAEMLGPLIAPRS
jgi:hypothetical protein